MQYNEFIELTNLVDDDVFLIQEASTLALKKVKLSTLKQYIGVTTQPIVVTPVSGAVKWYRMDDLLVNGTTITSIIDKISSNNLTSAIGNPTLVNNAINNKPAANFNNCAMQHQAEAYAAKHAFVVYRNNVATYNNYNAYICARLTSSNVVPNSNEFFIVSGVLNTSKLYAEGATNGYIDKIAQNINQYKDYNQGVEAGTVGAFHIVESIHNNSVLGTKNLCVGTDSLDSSWSLKNCDIAEIIIYPFELTEVQRTEIYSYFKQRYAFSFL